MTSNKYDASIDGTKRSMENQGTSGYNGYIVELSWESVGHLFYLHAHAQFSQFSLGLATILLTESKFP